MKLIGFGLLLLAFEIKAECPASDRLPVRFPEDESKYFCARFYLGPGKDGPFNGCSGCSAYPEEYIDVYDGQDFRTYFDDGYPLGSLVVRPGCTFYQFTDIDTEAVLFEGGVHQNVDNGVLITDGCAKGVQQMKCRCNLAEINCVPKDSFEVVMQCDATMAKADSECNYSKTIGSSFSQSLGSSMSVDYTIKAKLSVDFFELFSESIGASVSTGYDWTTVSSETISEEDTVTIATKAKAGYVTRIEQAVGHCGGSTARTELFRISDMIEGKIVRQSYHKLFNNGTIIDMPSDFMKILPKQRTVIEKVSNKTRVTHQPVSLPIQQ